MTVPPDEPNQLHITLTKSPDAKPGPAEIVAAIFRHMMGGRIMTDPDWTDDYDDDNPAVVAWRWFEERDTGLPMDEDSFREAADYCAEEVEGVSTETIDMQDLDVASRIWSDGWYHGSGVGFALRQVAAVVGCDEGAEVHLRSGQSFTVEEDPDDLLQFVRVAQEPSGVEAVPWWP